jgi:hypothetical protein
VVVPYKFPAPSKINLPAPGSAPSAQSEGEQKSGELMKNIYVSDTIARTIVDSLHSDIQGSENRRKERLAGLQQRLSAVRTRRTKSMQTDSMARSMTSSAPENKANVENRSKL